MEPITLATSFATIVSLIGTYKSEARTTGRDELQGFMQWLIETNHSDIKDLLEINTKATIAIKALLNEDRDQLFQKLAAIDEVLSFVASRVEGFGEISNALHPGAEVSEQAVTIMKQLAESEGSKFVKSGAIGRGPILLILGGKGGKIEYTEPQFVEDDLSVLVNLGLLNLEYNDKGSPLYIITRAAIKYLNAVQ